MQYTLDSVVQVEQALRTTFPNNKIDRAAVLKSGVELAQMVENPQIVYFGVLTVPPGVKCNLSYRGNETMTVEPGSQIIEAFTNAEFLDEANLPVASKGFFRGFEIQIANY